MSDKISRYEAKIDEAVRRVLEGEQPGTLFEPARYILELGGKRLRVAGAAVGDYLFEGIPRWPQPWLSRCFITSRWCDDLMDRARYEGHHGA